MVQENAGQGLSELCEMSYEKHISEIQPREQFPHFLPESIQLEEPLSYGINTQIKQGTESSAERMCLSSITARTCYLLGCERKEKETFNININPELNSY